MGKASRAAACVILRRLCQSAFSLPPLSYADTHGPCGPEKSTFVRKPSQHRVASFATSCWRLHRVGIVSIDRACADRPRVRALAAIWRVARCARVH